MGNNMEQNSWRNIVIDVLMKVRNRKEKEELWRGSFSVGEIAIKFRAHNRFKHNQALQMMVMCGE